MKTIPLLLCDFYKTVHAEQYPNGITKLVSYFTPRMSRLEDEDKLVCFGVQAFIKEYLIEYFNENFFKRELKSVVEEYTRILDASLGKYSYDRTKIVRLHNLGYLPLEINVIPEGTRVPIKVPMIEISNTHPDFAWVTNSIESLLSCSLWHTMISANVGFKYRQIVNEWYEKTVDDTVPRNRALGDFSMRGQESLESAVKSSAGFCLSFLNTATIPTIPWLEEYYNCDCTKEPVAYGSISTEHSVMCSNNAIDGNEEAFVKRLLTKIYPCHSFSMVSDSYDYWRMVTEILPSLKKEILEHQGTLLVRGDSGDPVDIICGGIKEIIEDKEYLGSPEDIRDYFTEYCRDAEAKESFYAYCKINNVLYKVKCDPEWSRERGGYTDNNYYFIDNWNIVYEEWDLSPENKGTVELLWEIFGGTVNSKGYKVLDSHIKAIYGDSITTQRCEEIYRRLEQKGFAANNVALGVGSFSIQCVEEEGKFNPFTRDTFGIAVKSTYCEVNGVPYPIFKNPKTDSGNFKKSQKGMCIVYRDCDQDGKIVCCDGFSYKTLKDASEFSDGTVGYNLLQTVFRDGHMIKEYTLNEIRERLHCEIGGF